MPINPQSLNFFAVLWDHSTSETTLRRINLEQGLQRQLSASFLTMATWWRSEGRERIAYTPTYTPSSDEVIAVSPFDIREPFRTAAIAPQQFSSFQLPLPEGLSLQGVVGIQAGPTNRPTPQGSLFLFQVSDRRQVLGRKTVILLRNDTFFRLTDQGLTIGDELDAVVETGELLFWSHFQANKLLDLSELYREATDVEVKTFLGHPKFIMPDGVTEDELLGHCSAPVRKKTHVILSSGILDNTSVTADQIKAYANRYDLALDLRVIHGQRRIVLPKTRHGFRELIRCLAQQFYTSELTGQKCLANSYRILPG